jgi:rhodanese-related sulfurtransferase
MSNITELLKVAHQRGQETGLPYEGALLPQEAFEVLRQSPNARLVDVRTHAETDWVGFVPNSILVEWVSWPDMEPNPQFLEQLKAQVPEDALLLFLCRSGARSHLAASAATAAGFPSCYNVLQGFEGDRDGEFHRNSVNGWRAAKLPWKQT